MTHAETKRAEIVELVNLSIDCKEVANKKIQFLRERFHDSGNRPFVIGLSGGIDSAVSLALAVQAVGVDNVIVVKMPYGELGKTASLDADLVIKEFDIPKENVQTIDIQPVVDALIQVEKITQDSPNYKTRKGNAMARARMMVLYDQSFEQHGQVLGTENKSEHLLGYFTRGGDEITDNEPIGDLYKVQVWQLARHLGVPEKIIKKIPTADLFGGQTDEGELGFLYALGDQILYCYHDLKQDAQSIIQRGFDPEIVHTVIKRIKNTEHKRSVPYRPSMI